MLSRGRGIPILMYHQIDVHAPAAFAKYVVTPTQFERQMRWLAVAGYATITVGRLLAHRRGEATLPTRAVAITLDDGYRASLEHLSQALAAHRFVATVFVVAGLVGGPSHWLRDECGVELPLADWNTLAAAARTGVTIGSHTLTHPRLVSLDDAGCRQELSASRHLLEDRLGEAVGDLAYPFGAYDERVRAMAGEAGYRSACSVRPGLSPDGDDTLALRRVPIDGGEHLLDFACRVATGHHLRDVIALARRRVRRLAGAA